LLCPCPTLLCFACVELCRDACLRNHFYDEKRVSNVDERAERRQTSSCRYPALARRATALEVITAAVRREFGDDVEVTLFGSAACGTNLPSSDLDVAVNGTYWEPPPHEPSNTPAAAAAAAAAAVAAADDNSILHPKMVQAAKRLGRRLLIMARSPSAIARIGGVMPITRSRVPVVKSEIGSVRVDVVFGQRGGDAAARWTLDHIASDQDDGTLHGHRPPRMPPLCRVHKAFLKQHNVSDVSSGGLGSHALTVAIVGYLASSKPQVINSRDGSRS